MTEPDATIELSKSFGVELAIAYRLPGEEEFRALATTTEGRVELYRGDGDA